MEQAIAYALGEGKMAQEDANEAVSDD